MKIGPRYLSKSQSFPDSAAEKAALSASLANAPGVLSMGTIEEHRKGGYRASIEVDRARLDDFIAHMDEQGWMDGF
ncbi:hypothetical protein M5C99_18615 [Acidovorax sp. NCPPB 2350]|nr:hypothetical protein M5C99_18615 [Acidovorax sp. NCPPB 2350]